MEELMEELNAIQTEANKGVDFSKTMALLRALKAGTVSLDEVTLLGDGWSVAETEPPADPDPEPPKEGE